MTFTAATGVDSLESLNASHSPLSRRDLLGLAAVGVGSVSASGWLGALAVEDQPVSAGDFLATVCEILGIDSQITYDGPAGRTVRLTDSGAEPIKELLPA